MKGNINPDFQLPHNIYSYFKQQCRHTLRYYRRQINRGLKEAYNKLYKKHPDWKNPKTEKEAKHILEILEEIANPWRECEINSHLLNVMWILTFKQIEYKLLKPFPGYKFKRKKGGVNRIKYKPMELFKIVEKNKLTNLDLASMINEPGRNTAININSILSGTDVYQDRKITRRVARILHALSQKGIDISPAIDSIRTRQEIDLLLQEKASQASKSK